MNDSFRIALAQIDLLVGDVQGNAARVIERTRQARDSVNAGSGAVSGAHPLGLPAGGPAVSPRACGCRSRRGCRPVREQLPSASIVVGFPEYAGAGIYNSAALIERRARLRPFTASASCPTTRCSTRSATSGPARSLPLWTSRDSRCALLVCEDIWEPRIGAPGPRRRCGSCCSSSTPHPMSFTSSVSARRWRALGCWMSGCHWSTCNIVGGQDELIFDGNRS